jgi:hypothetical protein
MAEYCANYTADQEPRIERRGEERTIEEEQANRREEEYYEGCLSLEL